MKVLIVHSEPIDPLPSGELEVARFEKFCVLQHQNEVKFIKLGDEFRSDYTLIRRLRAMLKNVWSFKAAEFLRSNIEEFQPDVIHFHGIYPYLSASALREAHKTGTPVIQTLHNGRWVCLEGGFYREGKYCDACVSLGGWTGVRNGCKHGKLISLFAHLGNLSKTWDNKLYHWVDKFIAVSEFVKLQHVRAGFPADKIIVKNNGMDLNQLRAARSSDLGQGVVYVGRLSKSKGTNVLKSIISTIDTKIDIVGSGPSLSELREYCQSNNFTSVKFWGNLPKHECLNLMALARCTVVPSQCGEALSLVACESMGVGTPVVGSDLGGLGPLIRRSGGGLIVDAQDLTGFNKAIQTLIDEPSLAAQLGQAGVKFVEAELGMEQNSIELMNIYKTVIEEKRNAGYV